MSNYTSHDIKKIPFPEGNKRSDGRWIYGWRVEFVDDVEVKQVEIQELCEKGFYIELEKFDGRHLHLNIKSDIEMSNNESYGFLIRFFSMLEMRLGEILKIQDIDRDSWPFFRFA